MIESSTVSMYASFQKGGHIDVGRRMVYGLAQLEESTPDLQGDIVDWAGTKRAFAKWKRNVREMHAPVAVGKALYIKPLEDEKQMLVGVRISTGAEDTWQKVLDGTLTGFSIGGQAKRVTHVVDPRTGRRIRKVLDYDLSELSLVDVPANPKCKVYAVQKNFVAPGISGDFSGKAAGMSKVLEAIQGLAESCAPGEKVIFMKRSDISIEGEGDEQKLILKSDADVSDLISKEELEAFGEGGAGGNDNDLLDSVTGEIQKMADAFCSVTKALGLDPVDLVSAAASDEDGVVIGKGLAMRSGAAVSSDAIRQMIDEAVGDSIVPIAKALDDLKDSLTTVQPRKGPNGDGTARTAITKVAAGTEEVPGEAGGEPEEISTLKKQLDGLKSKREAILAKMDSGQQLSDADKVESNQIGADIDRIEVALGRFAR